MSKINDQDLYSLCSSVPINFPGHYSEFGSTDDWRKYRDIFADRYGMELNQIIVGKLGPEDRFKYYEMINMNYDILLYILRKREAIIGYDLKGNEACGSSPMFKPVFQFLESKIPDIWQIGQTLKKDISNDFPINKESQIIRDSFIFKVAENFAKELSKSPKESMINFIDVNFDKEDLELSIKLRLYGRLNDKIGTTISDKLHSDQMEYFEHEYFVEDKIDESFAYANKILGNVDEIIKGVIEEVLNNLKKPK